MKRKRFEITNRLTSRVSNSLNIYLRELNNIPEVSTERIDELFYQYYYGDESVKDLLIRHNLRFVITVAKSYTSNIETLMDLINEGNYGLIKAIERYDIYANYKFSTYAIWYIRKYIFKYMEENMRWLRLPANIVQSTKTLKNLIDRYEQAQGNTGDIEQIIFEFEQTYKGDDKKLKVNNLRKAAHHMQMKFDHLDRPLSDHEDITLGDTISINDFQSTDHTLLKAGESYVLQQHINRLKPTWKRMLVDFYGLDGHLPMNTREIGAKYKKTGEAVRQMIRKAEAALRESMAEIEL